MTQLPTAHHANPMAPDADAIPAAMAHGALIPFPVNGAAGRVFALGLTYADHLRETGEKPQDPVVFMKHCRPLPPTQTTVFTPPTPALRAAIARLEPALATWLDGRFATLPPLLDYEVELGILLRQDVSLQQLQDPVFAPQIGFFIANDLTARSVQIAGEGAAHKLDFWSAAKSFADFLPVGDTLWCPHTPQLTYWPALTLQTRVNGQLRQSAHTSHLLYTPRQLLQRAAHHAPGGQLRQGDLILTGTPAGVALRVPAWKRRVAALLPRRLRIAAAIRSNQHHSAFLRPGDVLECSADWLGSRTLSIH